MTMTFEPTETKANFDHESLREDVKTDVKISSITPLWEFSLIMVQISKLFICRKVLPNMPVVVETIGMFVSIVFI